MSALQTPEVAFVQSFSLGSYSGGARILRSVCDAPPVSVSSVCTRFQLNPTPSPVEEYILPLRPGLGRLDNSRFAHLGNWLEPFFAPRFRRRLEAYWIARRPALVHLTPHSWGDFVETYRVAISLKLPFVISVHDDFAFTAKGHHRQAYLLKMLARIWQEARTRYVICSALGEEYCQRYGRLPYIVHSDGQSPLSRQAGSSRPTTEPFEIYFMGLFLNNYADNLRALIRSIELLQKSAPQNRPIRMRLRCHSVSLRAEELPEWVEVLPFAPEAQVRQEMLNADLLYLPLPFQESDRDFCRLSFSTKLISYLASGVPILYHGPAYAASGSYLCNRQAAIMATSLDPALLSSVLETTLHAPSAMSSFSENALNCCRSEFDPIELKRRFWHPIMEIVAGGSSSI